MPNTSNWCPEVYKGIFVDRVNDQHIRLAPCCQAESAVEPVEGFNFATSPYLQSIRQKFDQGEKPKECNRCWQLEELGQKSRRQSAIEFFGLPDTTIQLESFDHSATWACNLACIMCTPHDSSSWAQELELPKEKLIELGRLFHKANNFLDQFDLSKIKKVHFNGGEPMLNDHQTTLLEELEQQGVLKDAFISYNTNGTVFPDSKVINLWRRAKLVKIFFSIDGTGSAYNYIRYPGKWEQTQANILRMRNELPENVMFGFNVTVGCYNLFEVQDVFDWFQKNISTNREGDPSDFCWQFTNTDHYDIKDLTDEVKLAAMDAISIPGIVNHIKSTLNYTASNLWINELEIIDQRRGTNWQTSLQVGKYY